MIKGVKLGGADVAWAVIFCFWGVTHGLSLFSSWDHIIVPVKLLVYDIRFAEYDEIGFFSVGVNISDLLYFKVQRISFPMVTISSMYKSVINKTMWENLTEIEACEMLGYPSPMENLENEKCQTIYFD